MLNYAQNRVILAILCVVVALAWFDKKSWVQSHQCDQQQSGCEKSESKDSFDNPKTQSLWVPTDSVGLYTLVLSVFTGVLAAVSIFQGVMLLRADKTSAAIAGATQKQAKIFAAVEGPVPIVVELKIVPYSRIPGTNTLGEHGLIDRINPGPIPADCRVLISFENKGRTVAIMRELCIEKFVGTVLPANPTYIHTEPWGLALERGPIWIKASDALANITAAEVGAATAVYPHGGAFWVYGYFTYLNLLNETVERKFLARWDLAQGFIPDNRPGYT
jgi:hypothetical protein